jgi:hypothetical protein
VLEVNVDRGFTVRDDGETEIRLRKAAAESAEDADFIEGDESWIPTETLVDVLSTETLENGCSFYKIKVSRKGKSVVGYLRTKYIRPSEISGERQSKRQRR